ncbi:MAG: hypothetical protein J7513_14105 [Solirubrobacteraceae bacterium]|nr:hypothetical protein [Solirubrobacteraceae bacterium]
MSLPQQLLAIDEALAAAKVPHAFGGAIALAFYTLEPRGTRDLDVNIFVAQEHCAAALAALPPDVAVPEGMPERIAADGQARLWWADTPVDVFFDNLPIHRQAARHVRRVPFAGAEIPILGPIELVLFKAMFDRTKDWADIESVVAAGELDVQAARDGLVSLVGSDDVRVARYDDSVARGRKAAGDA